MGKQEIGKELPSIPHCQMSFHFYGIRGKGLSSVNPSGWYRHHILRVEDVNMDLSHLFADNFSRLLTYISRTCYNYFDDYKYIDYYE